MPGIEFFLQFYFHSGLGICLPTAFRPPCFLMRRHLLILLGFTCTSCFVSLTALKVSFLVFSFQPCYYDLSVSGSLCVYSACTTLRSLDVYCNRLRTAPRDIHTPTPVNVTLYGKRNFADVIILRVLR